VRDGDLTRCLLGACLGYACITACSFEPLAFVQFPSRRVSRLWYHNAKTARWTVLWDKVLQFTTITSVRCFFVLFN
jgi:hypothetical protein